MEACGPESKLYTGVGGPNLGKDMRYFGRPERLCMIKVKVDIEVTGRLDECFTGRS